MRTMQVSTLAAHRYVSSHAAHRTQADIRRRLNAYALKSPDCPQEVIEECAADMAALIVKERCILIPVPDHTGNTATNRRLAEAIALHARCSRVEVRDIFTRAEPVESTCARHRKKQGPLPVEAHRIVARQHEPFHLAPIYYIDNVTTSGNTLAACAAALFGFGTGLVYADATK